jgi:hypothetical protein
MFFRADEFEVSFRRSINTLIRMSAPRRELLPKELEVDTDSKSEELDDQSEAKEFKEEFKGECKEQVPGLDEAKRLSNAVPVKIPQDEKEIKELDRKTPLIEENAKAEAEKKDYEDFVLVLNQLRTMIFAGYQQAERKNDDETRAYLSNFATQMSKTIGIVKKPYLTASEKKAAINELVFAASPSPVVLKKADSVVSPIFMVLGGFIGLVVGIPIGALVGGGIGFGFGIYALLKTGGGISPDTDSVQFLLFSCALIGAIIGVGYGAYQGATRLGSYLYSLSHSTLFRPSEVGNNIEKGFLKSPVITRLIGKHAIEQQIKAADNTLLTAPEGVLSLVMSYASPADKEFAKRRMTR